MCIGSYLGLAIKFISSSLVLAITFMIHKNAHYNWQHPFSTNDFFWMTKFSYPFFFFPNFEVLDFKYNQSSHSIWNLFLCKLLFPSYVTSYHLICEFHFSFPTWQSYLFTVGQYWCCYLKMFKLCCSFCYFQDTWQCDICGSRSGRGFGKQISSPDCFSPKMEISLSFAF